MTSSLTHNLLRIWTMALFVGLALGTAQSVEAASTPVLPPITLDGASAVFPVEDRVARLANESALAGYRRVRVVPFRRVYPLRPYRYRWVRPWIRVGGQPNNVGREDRSLTSALITAADRLDVS